MPSKRNSVGYKRMNSNRNIQRVFCAGLVRIAILILVGSVFKACAADVVWLDWISFCSSNENAIVTVDNLDRKSPEDIKGIEISDASLEKCAAWGHSLSNVVDLRITSERSDPVPIVVIAATNFTKLRYLHLDIRNAHHISSSICLLTNLPYLGYLGLDAPNATNVSGAVFELSHLKELMVRLWNAPLPQGISRLGELRRMEVYGDRKTQAPALPQDFDKSPLEFLEVMNVSGVDEWLPRLPNDLVELDLPGCRLRSLPRAWIVHQKLQTLNLNNNRIGKFPPETLQIPNLRVLNLSLNDITNVPPIKLPQGKMMKIYLWGNPIRYVAPENKVLIELGNIEL